MEYVIVHSGVKGMKWGVRRYQNPDGSLTPEGRKRYGSYSGAKRTKSNNKIKKSSKNSVKNMTDEELRSRIARLQLEQQYATLNKRHASVGRNFAIGLRDQLAIPIAREVAKEVIKSEIKRKLGYK